MWSVGYCKHKHGEEPDWTQLDAVKHSSFRILVQPPMTCAQSPFLNHIFRLTGFRHLGNGGCTHAVVCYSFFNFCKVNTLWVKDFLVSPVTLQLIVLDKCPDVRPIGICNVARYILAKAILSVLRDDIQEAPSPKQLWTGQIAGIEAAMHAMKSVFYSDKMQYWSMPVMPSTLITDWLPFVAS